MAAGLTLTALILGQLALASHAPGSIDDLFILLAYARNLVDGHGLRYQAGGPTVDGFTSLLDLLWKSAALRWGPQDPVRAAWVATTLAYAGALLLGVRSAWRAASSAGAGLRWAVPSALALALTPGLAEGTTYLLGTPLYALLLLTLLAVAERPRGSAPRELVVAGVAFALVLARPEGLVPGAVVLALRACDRRTAARFVAPAAFAALLCIYFAWRLTVFGHWAPNSYYAKTSSSRLHELRDGLAYVGSFVRTVSGSSILVGALAALTLAARGAWTSEGARASCGRAAAAGAAALAGVVFTGGDCYLGARFLAPVAVLVLAANGAALCGLRGAWRAIPLAVLLGSFGGQLPTVLPQAAAKLRALSGAPLSEADFACERALCRRLADALPASFTPRIAQHDLQCLAWFAPQIEVLDTSGINTPHIAHLPMAEPVRFGRDGIWTAIEERCELIHIDFMRTRAEPWSIIPLERLLADPGTWRRFAGGQPYADQRRGALLEHYLPASVAVEGCGSGRWLNVFVRADLAPALRRAGFQVGVQ